MQIPGQNESSATTSKYLLTSLKSLTRGNAPGWFLTALIFQSDQFQPYICCKCQLRSWFQLSLFLAFYCGGPKISSDWEGLQKHPKTLTQKKPWEEQKMRTLIFSLNLKVFKWEEVKKSAKKVLICNWPQIDFLLFLSGNLLVC